MVEDWVKSFASVGFTPFTHHVHHAWLSVSFAKPSACFFRVVEGWVEVTSVSFAPFVFHVNHTGFSVSFAKSSLSCAFPIETSANSTSLARSVWSSFVYLFTAKIAFALSVKLGQSECVLASRTAFLCVVHFQNSEVVYLKLFDVSKSVLQLQTENLASHWSPEK